MKKILITGGAGFIGSHLGNKLVELGHEVVGVDNFCNPSKNVKNFDIKHFNFSDFIKTNHIDEFDAIFHLAAYINVDESIERPEVYFQNNVFYTQALLDFIRKDNPKIKFIFASSAEVYGSARTKLMSEDHPLDPMSPYAASKLAAEQLCKLYSQLYGLDVTIIRNFNTFGPYQRGGIYGGVIAKFKEFAVSGKALPVYGSGEQMRDYMYIDQAVDGYILALERKLPLIVNFGSGKSVKIIDIANYIAAKFGVKVYNDKPRPNELMRLEADISRAMQHGYKVETDFWKDLETYLSTK